MVLSVNKQGWLSEASGGGADECQSPVVPTTTERPQQGSQSDRLREGDSNDALAVWDERETPLKKLRRREVRSASGAALL